MGADITPYGLNIYVEPTSEHVIPLQIAIIITFGTKLSLAVSYVTYVSGTIQIFFMSCCLLYRTNKRPNWAKWEHIYFFMRFIKSFMKAPVGHMLVTGVENARLNVEIPLG